MAYRLPTERVELTLEDGPTVEVERVQADLIYQHAVGLTSAYLSATDKARPTALSDLYAFFVVEAQPTWQIIDHRGPIPPTIAGMARLPFALGVDIVLEWLGTHADKASAVDALIPPSPLRDQLNRTLREKRRAA